MILLPANYGSLTPNNTQHSLTASFKDDAPDQEHRGMKEAEQYLSGSWLVVYNSVLFLFHKTSYQALLTFKIYEALNLILGLPRIIISLIYSSKWGYVKNITTAIFYKYRTLYCVYY
jgi:hypothetical protein